jgi:hypothetical protein
MGRESASYWLALPSGTQEDVLHALACSGAEPLGCEIDRVDYCLQDPNRYWIDLRVHCRPGLRLEIRIALTNDTWAIRAPLERALTPLPPGAEGQPLLDDGGETVAIVGAERWWYALEDDYGRRRDEFVAVVGDLFAPISTDLVYTYLHQARKALDVAESAAERRELEVDLLEKLWETSPPPGEADEPPA